jgi:hypothetical protein
MSIVVVRRREPGRRGGSVASGPTQPEWSGRAAGGGERRATRTKPGGTAGSGSASTEVPAGGGSGSVMALPQDAVAGAVRPAITSVT